MRAARSIQTRVSLSVLLFGLMMILFNNWHNQSWLLTRRLDRLEQEATDTGSRLAGLLQHLSRQQQERAAELELSYVSLSPDVDLGLVCDMRGKVICATQLQWQDMFVLQTPLAKEWQSFAPRLESMEPVTAWTLEQQHFVVMFPFFENYTATSRAAVLIRYDATSALAQVRVEVWQESLRQAAVLLALCLLLWSALDELVVRRVHRLVETVRAAASLGEPAQVLAGEDELSLVSSEFAKALEQLRVAENLVLETAEQERRKIGRDLHDDLCQRLSATKMKTEVLQGMTLELAGKSASLARQVTAELAESVVIARSLAQGLSPVGIENHGLKDALENVAGFAERSYQVKCTLACADVHGHLTGSAQEMLFRIAQELTTNACKHSKPQVMHIDVRLESGQARLTIRHDGTPFAEPKALNNRGMGLHLLSQRLRALSATLERTVEKGERDFSIVTVRIPLNNPSFPQAPATSHTHTPPRL